MLTNKQALKLDIPKLKKVHFIGITAPFSSFCATYLIKQGIKVTASEVNQNNKQGRYWLDKKVLYPGGHDKKYITKDIDLIIYPNGPIPGNVECEEAEKLKIKAITIGQLTGIISLNYKTIAVAGTHGKTTTTALITWLLYKNTETPNFIVGDAEDKIAILEKNWNYNIKSKYLILEACEYKKQFIQRAPQPFIAVITHIDIDHTDFYKSQNEYNDAFHEFILKAKNIILDKSKKNELEVVKNIKGSVFSTVETKKEVNFIKSNLPGKHNQENLLRAYMVGKILKFSDKNILNALKTFPGISKRFEYAGKTEKGSYVYKDYAHNPKKIEALLQGAIEKHPNKKIILVIVSLLAVVLGGVGWSFLNNKKPAQQPVPNGTNQIETKIISVEDSTNFEGVEMEIYQNKNGYEISYPSYWDKLGLADTYGDQRDLSINYYFSPTKINEELHRLLLKPIGCEGDSGCGEYFEKYSKTEYSLFEIYVKKFDSGIELPDIQIPNAQKIQIVFPDGTKGVMWNQNSGEMRLIIINDTIHSYQYRIKIRNPQEYGLDFEQDILPILSTFKITE